MTRTSRPPPPRHLSTASRKWVSEIQTLYRLEPHHQRLLVAAATAWDRAEAMRLLIQENGAVTRDRFSQLKPSPAVAIEASALATFRQMVAALGLDVIPPGGDR